jgi:hypothetical protein
MIKSQQNHIDIFYEHVVPFIINREGNGPCPIETAVKGISCSKEAYQVMIKTLHTIKQS